MFFLATDGVLRQLPATFAAETTEADFVAEIGPGRILNVEFVTKPDIKQANKIVIYRGQFMQRHPRCSIFQVAIMLRGGLLPDVDDPPAGFYLGLTRIYLDQVDPAELMTQPNLACLAVLAQGDEEARRHYLGEALRGLQDLPEARQEKLVHAVLVMATMTVDPRTIDQIWEESGMTAESIAEYYSGTEIGRLANKINEKKAHDQGLEEGREQA